MLLTASTLGNIFASIRTLSWSPSLLACHRLKSVYNCLPPSVYNCRQGKMIQASRRSRNSVCQHKDTKNALAKIPTSHKKVTEATATLTKGQIVAPQNMLIVTRSASVNNIIGSSETGHINSRSTSVNNQPIDGQSGHNKTRSDSLNRKNRNKTRSESKYKKTGNKTRSESMNRKTNGSQSEHTKTRSCCRNRKSQRHQREPREAKSTTTSSTRDLICQTWDHTLTRAALGPPSQATTTWDHTLTRAALGPPSQATTTWDHTLTRAALGPPSQATTTWDHTLTRAALGPPSQATTTWDHTLTRAALGPPSQATTTWSTSVKQTVDMSAGGKTTTKVERIKRKLHGCGSETNCTSNRSSMKMKAGDTCVQKKEDSRTLEHSSLEEGEIIEGGSSSPAKCRTHRKRQRRSYKARDSASMTPVSPSKFMDKVEIVDLQQGSNSVRKRKSAHKFKQQVSTRRNRRGNTSTIDSCSANRKASHVDSARSGTINRSQVDSARSGTINRSHVDSARSGTINRSHVDSARSGTINRSQVDSARSGTINRSHVDSARSGIINRSQVDSCKPTIVDRSHVGNVKRLASEPSDKDRATAGGLEDRATAGGLEEGELLSDSDVHGNMRSNELLAQAGSDMSISSEDSLTDETVATRQLKDSCLLNSEGSWQGSSDKMAASSLMCSTAADSKLDPLATVFVPRLSVPDPAHQPNMPYSQLWLPFNAQSHFTQQQYWSKYQAPVHIPQTQKQNSNIADGFNPYSHANCTFPAPDGGVFSSVSSIWSYLPVAQQHSQWARVPSLQSSSSALPTSEMWATSSRAVGLESSGPTSARRIHIHPTTTHTCPEITNTCRCWQALQQVDMGASDMQVKVMCYNILSQELMERHMYLYTRCRDTHLQWDNRGAALLTQIMAHNADIVCLQEVEHDHWMQDIRDTLAEQGYAGVYKKQTGDNTHGCAILFKTSKFQLLKSIPVEFMKGGILDRPNIGLILLLQPRQHVYGGKVEKICVATTHLLFNPRRGDVKLAQLMVLLAEIDKHAYLDDHPHSGHKCCPVNDSSKLNQESQSAGRESSPEIDRVAGCACEPGLKNSATCGSADYCPIILCGDFNSEPLCDLYQFLSTGYLKYEDCISRLLCGQKEGRWGGTDRFLDRKLLPTAVEICETCQYLHVLKERHNRAREGGRLPKVNSGEVWHRMNFESVYSHCVSPAHREISTYHNNCCCTVDYIFYSQTGPRSGHLPLSADPENEDSRAAHFDGSQGGRENSLDIHTDTDMTAAIVDTDRPTFKEPLELVARYKLLTKNEVTKYGFMPNSVFPSDHLCLIATFVLR